MPSEEQDYFARYLKEGTKPAEDAKLDSDLQRLLAKLYARQRGEAQDLAVEQGRDIAQVYGTANHPYMIKEHRADADAQNRRFAEERERHIRHYQEAQKLRDQRRDNEISRDLDRGRTR